MRRKNFGIKDDNGGKKSYNETSPGCRINVPPERYAFQRSKPFLSSPITFFDLFIDQIAGRSHDPEKAKKHLVCKCLF